MSSFKLDNKKIFKFYRKSLWLKEDKKLVKNYKFLEIIKITISSFLLFL